MAIVYKKTDSQTEHVWFQSSNIYYTKTDFSKTESKAFDIGAETNIHVPTIDVIVVFNRGAQYLYKGVELHDYTSFIEVLNRDDSTSHGKAFNKFIKPYSAEKLDDMDITELRELKVKFLKEDHEIECENSSDMTEVDELMA